jgi:hypothetical protein
MKKYTVSELRGNGHVNAEVYDASDVDARIAELEKEVTSLVKQMPCTCIWSGWVGPDGSGTKRMMTCYRCLRLGTAS